MSGKISGVQQHIKEHAPMAIYIHCYSHCLSLVLVDSMKLVLEVSEFFTLLELLYVTRFWENDLNRTSVKINLTPPVHSYTTI